MSNWGIASALGDALEQSEAALERARTLVELGATPRRAGHRVEARGPLSEGMDLAHRCDAPRLVERDRELRVARLAANGRTNPEIAQDPLRRRVRRST